jgi:hypothetical protein
VKREAIAHTKMKRLCRRMDLQLWHAVGLLETLWLLTGREAPRGDIGKLTNEDIALGLDYRGDETALIEALVSTGWLDRDQVERLVIHDWADHADDAVHMRLARARAHFVGNRAPKLSKLPKKEREAAEKFYSSAPEQRMPESRRAHAGATPDCKPEPVPVPVPGIKNICASPNDARVGELPSIDNRPFATVEPESQFPVETTTTKAQPVRGMTAQQEGWFNEWWPAYWRHQDKKAARAAFAKQVKTETRFRQVMAATRAQRPEMLQREPQHRPYGATWLNKERWNDEPDAGPTATIPGSVPANGVGYRDMESWKKGIA